MTLAVEQPRPGRIAVTAATRARPSPTRPVRPTDPQFMVKQTEEGS